MSAKVQQLIQEIKASLAELEAEITSFSSTVASESNSVPQKRASRAQSNAPKKVFSMFGEGQQEEATSPVEEDDFEEEEIDQDQNDGEENEFVDVSEEEADAAIEEDDGMEAAIMECLHKCNPLIGLTPAEVSQKINVPRYRVVQFMRDMFFDSTIEKVTLRPISYCVKGQRTKNHL